MRVEKWISYQDAEKYRDAPCGGLGGFFDNGMRWEDYITEFGKESYPYIEAIRESVLKKGLKSNGSEHQNSLGGAPLFEDGTVATYSFRAWGDLMAAIWSEAENTDYCYMDFYC